MTNLYTYIQSDCNIAESTIRKMIRVTNTSVKYLNWMEYMNAYTNIYKYGIGHAIRHLFGNEAYFKNQDGNLLVYQYYPKSHTYVLTQIK